MFSVEFINITKQKFLDDTIIVIVVIISLIKEGHDTYLA